MIILGIDPGSRFCGYGVIDSKNQINASYLASGVIKLVGSPEVKLHQLNKTITEIKSLYSVDVVVCEKVFVYKNPHSTMKLSEARGVAIRAATDGGVNLFEYSPNTIKKTVVGNGHANKGQVQFMVKQILKIKGEIPEDASDALAGAICHAKHQIQNTLKARFEKAKQNYKKT